LIPIVSLGSVHQQLCFQLSFQRFGSLLSCCVGLRPDLLEIFFQYIYAVWLACSRESSVVLLRSLGRLASVVPGSSAPDRRAGRSPVWDEHTCWHLLLASMACIRAVSQRTLRIAKAFTFDRIIQHPASSQCVVSRARTTRPIRDRAMLFSREWRGHGAEPPLTLSPLPG